MGNYIRTVPVFSGGTVSGNTEFVGDLSGSTFYSGATNLYNIFLTPSNGVVEVISGTNILTGGTKTNPIIKLVPSPSINNLTFSGEAIGNMLSANTISGETFYSGSTPLQTIIQNLIPIDYDNYLSLSGGTISGTTNFDNGAVIQSGGTDLYNIFLSNDIDINTYVQPGLNTYTGGTDANPTVNISAATLTSLSSTTISGDTFYSGSTSLDTIINNIAGQYSGITGNYLSLSGGTISGTTNFDNGAVIQSGGTDLYNIFSTSGGGTEPGGSNGQIQFNNNNCFYGNSSLYFDIEHNSLAFGGSNNQAANNSNNASIIGGVYNIINLNSNNSSIIGGNNNNIFSFSQYSSIIGGNNNSTTYSSCASTIIGGNTNSIIQYSKNSSIIGGNNNSIDNQSCNSIIVGGINNFLENCSNYSSIIGGKSNGIINSCRSVIIGGNGLQINGQNDTVLVPNLISSSINSGIIQSGGTDLYNIFLSNDVDINTNVQPGLNTYTGGTSANPTVNISAATLTSLSSTTISGGTFYSGSTPLQTIIKNLIPIDADNYLPLSGGTVSGTTNFNNGAIIQSGGTDLYNIFLSNDVDINTNVQPGLNTYTGGTSANPTVNISAATLTSLSSTTISGGTFYSGSTPLQTIIKNLIPIDADNYLPLSGGTVTGTTNFNNGAIIQSGGTDLYNIFSTGGGGGGTPAGSNGQIQFNNSNVFGASSSLIFNCVNNSSIFGGTNNTNTSCSKNASVLGGCSNKIQNFSYQGSIIGGFGNTLDSSAKNSSIIGGGANCIEKCSYDSSIIGGFLSKLSYSSESSIIGGIGGKHSCSNTSNIIGGNSNFTCYMTNSSIIGGACNLLQTGNHNSIIGGYKNMVNFYSYYSSIIGGKSNITCADSSYSAIIGGFNNTIYNSQRSAIIGGTGLTLNFTQDMVMVPNLIIANLPTSNPGVSGQLWNNCGVINVS